MIEGIQSRQQLRPMFFFAAKLVCVEWTSSTASANPTKNNGSLPLIP